MNGGSGPGDGDSARRARKTRSHPVTPPQEPRPGPDERPRRGRGGFRVALILLLLCAGSAAAFVIWALSPVGDAPESVEFEVLPGWGAARVAQELESEGLVRNGRIFSTYLRLRGFDRSIGEGLFELDRSDHPREIAVELVRGGRPRVAIVVLPEGLRGQEVADRLADAGLGSPEEYRRLIESPGELAPRHVPAGASLEGYLFPASYELPFTETPEQILRRLLGRFEREIDAEVERGLTALGLSVHDWVTLASMVQAEAGSDQEMPLIAGVFLNRLDLDMLLQSDPTVAYGLGKKLPELDAVAGDIRRDHPWNTYTRPGLPEGPIANPGRAALRSVLEPVRLDERGRAYLYFLHGSAGGEPVFRLNTGLEGHNEDVARYLRGE